jgi:nitroreductase
MDFAEVLARRRMVRDYDPRRGVDRAVVDRLLAAAIRAPSAGFSQGWDFLALTASPDRDLFWATTSSEGAPDAWLTGMRRAPVLVLCLSNKDAYLRRYAEPDKGFAEGDEDRWPVPYWHVDTGMAGLLILLAAVDEGLGACFFGVAPDRQESVKQAFGVPAGRTIVGVVSVGHPAVDEARLGSDRTRARRGVGDAGHDGRFGVPWAADDGAA